ncbi:THUMP domain-containing class I SAM-dependent RNA methyltransferase [Aquimarina brevivitae]|uniref:Putative N6-adenine-specific DNA methylase n=1 Tax=Aquimarina brevivitae TaxID=323412 RepID=A0A4Q7NUA5_9FLAO|nr:THUMP domain-containing protein [Aquimarina brevivitae]RZS90428.1 putative N6-adenine-specific DNA methylase [Aquimarina brevivitae]
MVAKTLFGFEDLLADELKSLGAGKVSVGNRMVSFYGDKGFMYKANLCCRTAIKILKPIHQGNVGNEKDLYDFIQSIAWDEYLDVDDTFAIYATVFSEAFTHSHYVSLKVKDAIVDKFRKEEGRRPDVDTDYPDLTIDIHIQHNSCTVSLDSSGKSLHQRGYRNKTNIAPINEVLAAGLLMRSGWKGNTHFLDPMCGSGTIAIEAAMIACNIPPNLNRKEFAFEKWLDWDMDLFETIEEACLNKIRKFDYTITGMDLTNATVKKAMLNVESANLSEFITIKEGNFFESKKSVEGPLQMLFNPPYGERLEVDIPEFYKQIGDTLKQNYPGTIAWFITSNMEGLKNVGLRPSRKIKVFNGKLESRLVRYEMYEGSRKAKYNKDV